MLISTYNEWCDRTERDLAEQDAEVDCPNCDGEGAILELEYCDLDFCEACEGTGDVPIRNLNHYEIRRKILTHKAYFDAVVQDLKRYCVYTGTDFLDAVASFVKENRQAWSVH